MHIASIGRNDTGYCLRQCCFACPIRPDQAQHFSFTYIEGDIDQCTLRAVALLKPAICIEGDAGSARCRFLMTDDAIMPAPQLLRPKSIKRVTYCF
jgi:hypothetical protein